MWQSLGIEFDDVGVRRSILESATSVCLRKSRCRVYQWSLYMNVHNRVCDPLILLRQKTTLVLSNIRELNRVPSTTFYLIYKFTMVCATLLQPYPKQPCVCLKINMCQLYHISSFSSRTFYVILLCHVSMWLVWHCHVTCDGATLCLFCLMINNKI